MSQPSTSFGRKVASDYARMNTCQGEWILKLAELDITEEWRGDGCSNCVQWLQVYCGMARSTAKEKLRVARELGKRPVVARALSAGVIPYSKARELTRLVGIDHERDEQYVADAPTMSMPRLEGWVKQWNWNHGQDAKPANLDDHYGIRRERGFGGGLGRIVIELPDDDIDRIFAVLDAYIDHVYRRDQGAAGSEKAPLEPLVVPVEVAPVEPPVYAPPTAFDVEQPQEERRALPARRLDALVDLFEEVVLARDDEIDPERAAIGVTIAYEDLVERAGGAGLGASGSVLTGEAVRRLCCDANMHRIVVKGVSEVLDVGRSTRQWSTPQRRAIRARHGHRCAAEGCGRRITHIHHMRHWEDGGPTDIDNGVPLCFYHHHLVHEGGWSVAYDVHSGITRFEGPHGQVMESQATFRRAA